MRSLRENGLRRALDRVGELFPDEAVVGRLKLRRLQEAISSRWPELVSHSATLLILLLYGLTGDEGFSLSGFGLSKWPRKKLRVHVPRLRRIHQRPRDRDE